MATSSTPPFISKTNKAATNVSIASYLPGTCPVDAIDPTVLLCETDGGCQWAETCEDGNYICIDGVWYMTWRPKGIKDDYCPEDGDPGCHLHLSCNAEQTGIRLKGKDIVKVLKQVTDPEVLNAFCDWLKDTCLDTEEFYQFICDIIVGHCFEQDSFTEAFCEWLVNVVMETPEFMAKFLKWLKCTLLENPEFIEIIKEFIIELFEDPEVRDALCEVLSWCLENDPDVRDAICETVRWCLENDPTLKDTICTIFVWCIENDTDTINAIQNLVEEFISNNPDIFYSLFDDPGFKDLLCQNTVGVYDFDSSAGEEPVCVTDGPCIQFFNDTSAECGGGGGGDPVDPPTGPAFNPETLVCEAGYSFASNDFNCGPVVDNGPTSTNCGDPLSATGSCGSLNPFPSSAHRLLIDTEPLDAGGYEICLDYSDQTQVNNTFFILWDSSGNKVQPDSISYTNQPPLFDDWGDASAYIGGPAACGDATHWANNTSSPFSTTLCLTYNSLTAGIYTANIGDIQNSECVSNLSIESI